MHQHGLDQGSVGEAPQPLDGLPVVTGRAGLLCQACRELTHEAVAQACWECRDLRRVGEVLVEALPELVDPIVGLVAEQPSEGGPIVVVAGDREPRWGGATHRTIRWKARSILERRNPSSS